jgi:hypothetical protein
MLEVVMVGDEEFVPLNKPDASLFIRAEGHVSST